MSDPERAPPSLSKRIQDSASPLVLLILTLWVTEIVNLILGHRLNVHGILPRHTSGLPGIVFSPFLHTGITHLLSNTLPLLVLGGMASLGGARSFVTTTVLIILFGGLGVWSLGRSAFHVGASGLVFGYFGYLVFRAWYTRTLGSIAVALVTLALYSGMIWGVLPQDHFISWEAHFFGFLAGVLVGRLQPRVG